MSLKDTYNSLCTPSKFYFILSCISILALFIHNLSDPRTYKVGLYHLPLRHHNFVFFIAKALYIMAWTWALNKLCKSEYKGGAWFLVLLPFIGFFILIGVLLMAGFESAARAVKREV